jgi:DNA-binding LytR/AlgR family response regulator
MKTLKNLRPNCKTKVRLYEIVQIEADINNLYFILQTGKKIILARTLKAYEKDLRLPFLRVSKSCMVNIRFLDGNQVFESTIVLKDGFQTSISRRRVEFVSRSILNFKH